MGWTDIHPRVSADGKDICLDMAEFESFYIRHVIGLDPDKAVDRE